MGDTENAPAVYFCFANLGVLPKVVGLKQSSLYSDDSLDLRKNTTECWVVDNVA